MVSLRGPSWVGAAGFVLVAVGLGFLVTGAPVVGIGLCALALGLVAAAARSDDETESASVSAPDDAPAAGDGAPADPDDALTTLRERYARGELSDAQFEAKLERLLEVETLEDVAVSVERRGRSAESDREAASEAATDLDRETNLDRETESDRLAGPGRD